MISIIFPTHNSAETLPRALSPLVAGVAAGVVKEAIVADGASTDETPAVAEAAGCTLVRAPYNRAQQLIAGAKAARGDWLLILEPDTVLCEGWLDEVRRFMGRAGAQSRVGAFRLVFEEEAPLARRIELSARTRSHLLKSPYADQGLLISRRTYDMLGGYHVMETGEHADIMRRIGGKRLALFRTEIIANFERHRRRRADAFAALVRWRAKTESED